MAYVASFGLPADVPELASALSIESAVEKHIIKDFQGVDNKIHQFNPTTKFSMTVEAIDSALVPGDGAALAIPGLPTGGYCALDSVKQEFKQDGNAQQVFDGVVHPSASALA